MSGIETANERGPSAAHLLEKTLHDGLELARAEISLAKREVAEQARAMSSSALFFVAGVMFLQAAITTLGVLLVLLVHSTALGFAVVGGLLLVAAALGLVGVRVVKGFKLNAPERLKLDARKIAEAVK
jgi:cytochrome c biogenesis protein CcdA